MQSKLTPVRKIAILLASLGVVGVIGAGGAVGIPAALGTAAAAESGTLALRQGASLTNPQFEIHSSSDQAVHLTFDLPALALEQYDIEGTLYQSLQIPGGQLYGDEGAPALPGFTRYVAIPARAGVELRVIAVEEETLDGYRLLPMISDNAEAFEIDQTAYANEEFLGREMVSIGDPAILRDLRVVPLRFHPVQYNPASGEIRVAHRVEIELRFAGVDLRNAKERGTIPLTPAFDKIYEDLVVNYESPSGGRSGELAPHLGTWVIISVDNGLVLTMLEPLVEWRRQMGYNVYQTTTTETGTNPNSIRAWLQNAYNSWEYPPEFITIVGDVSGSYPIGSFACPYYSSSYGDHPYCQLDGDDLMPDAFIGRLSGESANDLTVIVDKIVSYESQPRMDNSDWFKAATLVGDPSTSGWTCVQIQQWLKEKLLDLGYARCDTIFAGPWTTQMRNSVNAGVGYFGYRGYYGMSGWSNSYINGLTNTDMLPFCINLTCGTGSFYSGTSISEAWLRAYSSTYGNIGGIGSIATATLATNTRFNNCYYGGAARGLFWGDSHHLGVSGYRGKVELILNYQDYDYSQTGRFIWWNNLMGDPATEIWTDVPAMLTVQHPATVPVGADHIDVYVSKPPSHPVPNAYVHLRRDGVSLGGGYTDAQGHLEMPIDASVEGAVELVVTGRNLYPHIGGFQIGQQAVYVAVFEESINDDDIAPSDGNGDGLLNPGETVELAFTLKNFGYLTAQDVSVVISANDPYAAFLSNGTLQYGLIMGGSTKEQPAYPPLVLRVAPGTPAGHRVRLDVEISSSSSEETWSSIVYLTVAGARMEYMSHQLGGVGDLLEPGETGTLAVTVANSGTLTAQGPIQVTLVSESYSVQVTDPYATLSSSITPGGFGSNALDPFSVRSPLDCIPGLVANLRMTLKFADGVSDTVHFQMQVGTAGSHDPTGPDDHGYFAYDHTDVAYDDHPVYSWIEISPTLGGPGTDVGLTDFGVDQDDFVIVQLPFPFTFYGETFDLATICSNGWVAMGSTYLTNYRNWHLPSAGGPAYQISPFWDNHCQDSSSRVYHWFDEELHRYVITWHDVRLLRSETITSYRNRFQVILYDPEYYPTLSGDGEIVMQYHTVNNQDYLQMYTTVGIQDGDHDTGITFNYYNSGPPTAAPLSQGLAVKFTTGRPGFSDAAEGQPATRLALSQNHPNPMSLGTSIRFRLPAPQSVSLRVYDVDGHLVRTLVDGSLPPGEHLLQWTGTNDRGLPVSSGVYFYRLESGGNALIRKLMVVR